MDHALRVILKPGEPIFDIPKCYDRELPRVLISMERCLNCHYLYPLNDPKETTHLCLCWQIELVVGLEYMKIGWPQTYHVFGEKQRLEWTAGSDTVIVNRLE